MAKVVSFINFKGGVGKTTLCVETAASLAGRSNARVLLIDLDPQTNATPSFLGCFRRRHGFANAAPSLVELTEFRIGSRQM